MVTHVAIIGAYGSAGVAVADELVDEPDIRLTLIDDGEPGGGLCILRGCMPSKEVLSAGAHRYQVRHDHRLVGAPPEVDLEEVISTKDDHIHGFAAHRRSHVHDLAEREDVSFIHDSAHFVDDRTLVVGDERIEPDYVVVATGSKVNIPQLPGIQSVEYSTSTDVLEATTFPDSGIVMGFGYVGLELVPYLSEAGGMDLTVIEHDDRPLDEADPAFGDTILDLYEAEFSVDIRTNVTERSVKQTADGGIELEIEDTMTGATDSISADSLFLFTGRQPNIDRLGLEQTSLEPTGQWVHETMQARDDDRVFIVGDANGMEPILHVAKEQGFQAAENLLAHREEAALQPYENITHHVVFTGLGVYPYARVGETATTAHDREEPVVVVSRSASDDGVFKTKAVPHGHATLVADAADGTVLGYQGLHYHADVMAKTMQIVIEGEMDVRTIPDRAFHPTTPEILDGLFREASSAVEDHDG